MSRMSVIQGANWQGSQKLATRQQLLSTSTGLYDDLKDFNFSTIQVSTLNVPQWISTALLYVSDIQGASIDISGITINKDGVFNAPVVSLSTMNFKGFDSLLDLDVSFDFGLGQAIGGLLGGLGALVGGATIAVGTGAGLAIQGAEQGIAAMVAGRPENYINQSVYETINFTSQLQVSTLGNAYPVYSTIFRTVSSVSANQVPGPETFVSTFFYPGQICIRSVSDPFNLISGNSNLNTSTIQSFGQWVPFNGLEPENIEALSVSTINLQASNAFVDFLRTTDLTSYYAQISTLGVITSAFMNYEAPVAFQTGANNQAAFVGYLNRLYCYNQTGYIFSGDIGSTTESASLYLGTGSGQSILNVSTVNTVNLTAVQASISSLVVTDLLVLSTLSTVYTQNAISVLSTSEVTANFIGAEEANISSLTISTIGPYQIQGLLGNPTGPFDISRYDFTVSTTYDQISSLTQNILNYSLNNAVQSEAVFNIGDNPGIGLTYEVTPANISQWASTQLVFNGYQGPGGIDLGWVGQWGVTPGDLQGAAPGGATFDVLYEPNPNGANAPFYLTEQSNRSYPVGLSTFYQQTDPNPPSPISFSARMTLPPIVGGTRSGWWQMTTPAPPPYETSNNNTFQIYQDINDTYIQATDRLHIQSGDIFLEGRTHLSNVQINNLDIDTVEANTGFISTLYTQNAQVSSFASQSYSNLFNFTGSYNTPGATNPLNFQYNLNSTDFATIRTLTVPSRGPNMFNSQNVNEWNNTMYNQPVGTNTTTGPPMIYLGEPKLTSGYSYGPAKFWINNTTSGPALAFPVQVIKQGGWTSTLGAATTTGTGYTLIQTPDGVNWSITSNVPNPQSLGGYSFSNSYSLQMNQNTTQLNVGMPFNEIVSGTKTITANKVMLNANQIRTTTFSSPSYPSREAGFELSSYFDANVVFLGGNTFSDAVNNIISPQGSLGYALNAWSPQLWFGRIRTDSFGIQGEEIEGVVASISGTFADFIWASHRYLNVTGTAGAVSANIREIYFMVPYNWFTYTNFPGPY